MKIYIYIFGENQLSPPQMFLGAYSILFKAAIFKCSQAGEVILDLILVPCCKLSLEFLVDCDVCQNQFPRMRMRI